MPTSADANSSGSIGYQKTATHSPGTTLTDAAVRSGRQWATPAAQDAKNATAPPQSVSPEFGEPPRDGRLVFVPFPPGPDDADGWADYLARYPGLEPVTERNGKRMLAPNFDEALMGLPPGWTAVCDCKGLCACDRLPRLAMCGNSVVPLQGAEAFRQLMARASILTTPPIPVCRP